MPDLKITRVSIAPFDFRRKLTPEDFLSLANLGNAWVDSVPEFHHLEEPGLVRSYVKPDQSLVLAPDGLGLIVTRDIRQISGLGDFSRYLNY